jgi:predicted nucleic-acid-binding protein
MVAMCNASTIGKSAANALGGLLHAAQVVVEDVALAYRALARYQAGSADFADYLIAERAVAAGCDEVATFDKKMLAGSGFVEPG